MLSPHALNRPRLSILRTSSAIRRSSSSLGPDGSSSSSSSGASQAMMSEAPFIGDRHSGRSAVAASFQLLPSARDSYEAHSLTDASHSSSPGRRKHLTLQHSTSSSEEGNSQGR